MSNVIRFAALAASLLGWGCGDSGSDAAGSSGGEGSGTGSFGPCGEPALDAAGPYRDEWRLEAEVPFDPAFVTFLGIGGRLMADNFANRGDVIVAFDDVPTIRIEVRRFSTAQSPGAAQADFDATRLIAYRGALPPLGVVEPAEDCVIAPGWPDFCEVQVVYDALAQPARTGADVRVTMPAGFRGRLEIETDDNDADADYPSRGSVCVAGLNASVDIRMGSGVALVALTDDVSPIPLCSPENVAACEGWPDGSASLPWDPACPCFNAGLSGFGSVQVATHEADAANVTIDIPPQLWASLSLDNIAATQIQGGMAPGEQCDATIQAAGYVPDPGGTPEPWSARGIANEPDPVAFGGGGFSIRGQSTACAAVSFVESPCSYAGPDTAPATEERGNLRVCNGCLAALDCTAVLDGL